MRNSGQEWIDGFDGGHQHVLVGEGEGELLGLTILDRESSLCQQRSKL